MKTFAHVVFWIVVYGFSASAVLAGFSFSEEAEKEQAVARKARQKTQQLLNVGCSERIKAKSIGLIIGETHSDHRVRPVSSGVYGPHFNEINKRLKRLGLRTFTQEEIKNRIAAAEADAFLNNDPDAALQAASRLGANFLLRGILSSRSHMNPIAHANEVFVDMSFTLTDASGRYVSDVSASDSSWSGQDTRSVALMIVQEQADRVVAQLYHDYCLQ